jgi:Tol biopolymer transport system component
MFLASWLSAFLCAWGCTVGWCQGEQSQADLSSLRKEVAAKGWILFSALTPQRDYDLFICRPDGSAKRNLTRTPHMNEFGGRFSPDGKRILYRQMPKDPAAKPGKAINHDLWGAAGSLVFANANGSNPQVQGKDQEYPWASWSPDCRQIACLYKREGKIRIFEAGSKKLVRELPRQGIFQQMFWSPDGARLCGTANLEGRDWNVVSLELATGKLGLVSRNLCCTPDWFKGTSDQLIYSCRIPGMATAYGWTMLMQGAANGQSRSLLYAERGRHIYYGNTSPDDKYALFSTPESDGGTDAEMAIIRIADAPIVMPSDYRQLLELYPNARSGPVVRLGQVGFEPDWTFAEVREE